MKKPFSLYILIFLHFLLSISAMAGGGMLLVKPDGSLLGMQQGWLNQSPFESYFIPGLILFSVIGLFSFIVFAGLLRKPSWRVAEVLNIYNDRHWAWTWSLYEGIALISWITIQLIMTRYFWLQPFLIFWGLMIIIFTMIPSVISYFKISIIDRIKTGKQ